MEGWIAVAVAALLGAVYFVVRGLRSSQKAPVDKPETASPPEPLSSGSEPNPPGSPMPLAQSSKKDSEKPISQQSTPSAGLPLPTAQGKKAEALVPIAPFDPAATASGLLVKAVLAAQFEEPEWICIEWDGLLIHVGAHALRARVGEHLLRLPVSWMETLTICKKLGYCPPTSELSDAIWKAATVRVEPVPMGNFSSAAKTQETSKKMSRLAYCLEHNQNVDAAIVKGKERELASTEGKDWILSKRNLTTKVAATTYGWHTPNGKPIQGLGPDYKPPAHDAYHFDQTQVLRPIRREAALTSSGAKVDLLDELEKRGLPAGVMAALRGQ